MKKLYSVDMTAVTYGESEEEAEKNIRRRVLIVDDVIEVDLLALPYIHTKNQRVEMNKKMMEELRRLDK